MMYNHVTACAIDYVKFYKVLLLKLLLIREISKDKEQLAHKQSRTKQSKATRCFPRKRIDIHKKQEANEKTRAKNKRG